MNIWIDSLMLFIKSLLIVIFCTGDKLILQDPKSIFNAYWNKGCQFECRLRFAALSTGCIPWDYPVPEDLRSIDICLSMHDGKNLLKEFNLKMEDPDSVKGCDCLPDCEETTYETQVSKIVVPCPVNKSPLTRGKSPKIV